MDKPKPIEQGTKVRFAQSFLERLTPTEARRYVGRTGVVSGYRMGANEPIVDFAKDGRRPALRLFEVALNRLEIVKDSGAE